MKGICLSRTRSLVLFMVLADDVVYVGAESKMLVYHPLCTVYPSPGKTIVINLALAPYIFYNGMGATEIRIVDPAGNTLYTESMGHFFDDQKNKHGGESYFGTAGFTADEGVQFTQSGLHKAAIYLDNQQLFETH